jgi:uncharacterized protein YdeI (YjbR/CyaY-like superfamily)
VKSQRLNPQVDSYIGRAQPFAKPILEYLRTMVHMGCPEAEETMKWSRPFFEYRGAILCNMAAFKEHCSFGFWGEEIGAVLRDAGAVQDGGVGSLGRISSTKDLPSERLILGWVRQAVAFVESGNYTSPIAARRKVVKPQPAALNTPPEFAAALKRNKKASVVFVAFSPSCKKEYIEWITEAKRPETRDKRIETAVEWIAEGKQRNWKYQNC